MRAAARACTAPDAELFFITGADAVLRDPRRGRTPTGSPGCARFIAATRPGLRPLALSRRRSERVERPPRWSSWRSPRSRSPRRTSARASPSGRPDPLPAARSRSPRTSARTGCTARRRERWPHPPTKRLARRWPRGCPRKALAHCERVAETARELAGALRRRRRDGAPRGAAARLEPRRRRRRAARFGRDARDAGRTRWTARVPYLLHARGLGGAAARGVPRAARRRSSTPSRATRSARSG